MISIDELLEEMDSMLDKAVSVPLSGGKAMVNTDKLREIIDDIRLHLPNEIRQARAIAAERNDIISEARKEAESITRKAEERARAMINQEEVVRKASIQASEMVSQAQTKAREIRKSAIDYAENLMRTTEDAIGQQLADLRQARQSLRTTVKNDPSSGGGPNRPSPRSVNIEIDDDDDDE